MVNVWGDVSVKMSGTRTAKQKRDYEEYERSNPACPCCALRMPYEIMEGHLYQDHSAAEYVDTIMEFAHQKFRKDNTKSYIP